MTAKQILTLLELPGIGRKSIIKLLRVKSVIADFGLLRPANSFELAIDMGFLIRF